MRAQIKTVLIPEENKKDLKEVPNNVKKAMHIISVAHIDEVFKHALVLKDLNELYKNVHKGTDLLDIYENGEESGNDSKQTTVIPVQPAAH